MISSLLSPDQNLQGILASLSRILTPTEKLPGNSPIAALLAQPHMVAPQYGQQQSGQSIPQRMSVGQSPTMGQQGSSGSSGISSVLSDAGKLKNLYSSVSSLFGPSLGSLASGAAANGAVTSALGSVGAQTAPEAASIQAGNDAALQAMNGGSLGASAGLLSLEGLGSGAAANAAVASALAPTISSELGSTAAGIEAANDAALGGSAASSGSGAATGAGLGAGAGAALGIAALPLALAAFVPTGENAHWWQGLSNQINNPATSMQGKLTLANDLMNNPGDNPYTQAQLNAWGIPQIMKGISQPITTPMPGGQGWIGGSARGMSRV